MAKKNCDIYGPDLSEHEQQGRDIADMGMRCMKSSQKLTEADSSTGKDASHSELEKWQPKP